MGLNFCMTMCQNVLSGVSEKASNSELSHIRSEVGKIGKEVLANVHEKAQNEGTFTEKLSHLEEKMKDVQRKMDSESSRKPEVVVIQPTMVPVQQNSSEMPKKKVEKLPGAPRVEICELVPLEGETPSHFGEFKNQEDLIGCMGLSFEDPTYGNMGENPILVAPVEVGVGTAPMESLGIFNLPIIQHLSKSQTAPKFSNKKEDWHDFVWKFESWLMVITAGKKLADHETLQLFITCLPENLQREMQLWEKERGKPPTYVEFRARLEARFGKAQVDNLRKKWMDVHISKGFGKIGVQQLDEFRVNFKLAWVDVPDATPEESRRVLLEKLPPFMRKWVVEAEARKMKNRPIIQLVAKENWELESLKQSVGQWVGAPPSKVEVKGRGTYHMTFLEEEASRKILDLHGREIRGFDKKLQVREVEQHLSVEEIFREIRYQMELQEKTADFPRNRGNYGEGQVRKASIDQEKNYGQEKKKTAQNPDQGQKCKLVEKDMVGDGQSKESVGIAPYVQSNKSTFGTVQNMGNQAQNYAQPWNGNYYGQWSSGQKGKNGGKGYFDNQAGAKGFGKNGGYKGGRSNWVGGRGQNNGGGRGKGGRGESSNPPQNVKPDTSTQASQ